MKMSLIRALCVAAAAGSIALIGAGTSVAEPVGVVPVAAPTCPDPPNYGVSCSVAPDGLTVDYSSKGGRSTSHYDKLGNFICTTQNYVGPLATVTNAPCNLADAAVRALPPFPLGQVVGSASR